MYNFCVDSIVYFGTSVHTVDESSGSVQITLILSNQLSTEVTVTVTDEPGNATSKAVNLKIMLLNIVVCVLLLYKYNEFALDNSPMHKPTLLYFFH